MVTATECLPRSRITLCFNKAPALINIQLLGPIVASITVCCTKKHVKSHPQPKTLYSTLQGYFSNLVKALGNPTAPTAVQWGEDAGGEM